MATKNILKPSDESPYGGERLLRPKQQMMDEIDRMTGKAKIYDKQAADAKANRTEAEQEALDNALDAMVRKKEDKAPTTKTNMGNKPFAKGGSIRGGGIEQRGKTKGRFV
jgi:hypothetical protein